MFFAQQLVRSSPEWINIFPWQPVASLLILILSLYLAYDSIRLRISIDQNGKGWSQYLLSLLLPYVALLGIYTIWIRMLAREQLMSINVHDKSGFSIFLFFIDTPDAITPVFVAASVLPTAIAIYMFALTAVMYRRLPSNSETTPVAPQAIFGLIISSINLLASILTISTSYIFNM